MKTKKYIKRIFSFVLATILLFSAISVSLAVQDMLVEEVDAKIVREVTELREESVKHFLCEDGSIIAATYSEPIHFFENGQWKEINNELTLTSQKLSSSGEATYSPKRSGISVSIPQTFSDGQQITAIKEDYKIKFSLDCGNSGDADEKTVAKVSKIESLPSHLNVAKTESFTTEESTNLAIDSVASENEKMMEVEKKSGAVVYKNILPNTDLEYIVSGCSIKENIVVHKPQSEYRYTFDIDIDDLTPVKNENGSISLFETGDNENPVFHINAPYMYDSNGVESPNVEMSLITVNGKSKLVLNADEEWINSPDRLFPVIIDPTFSFGNSAFEDVFVEDGVFANSTRIGNELRVGKNLTNTTRTYIKMVLPTNIPRGSKVTSASLTLKKDSFFQAWLQDDIKIYAYDGKDANPWSAMNVTWNNQPNFSFDGPHILDKIDANESKTTYTFNIQKAVSRWIEYGENNGICLRSSNENSKTQVDFHSSRVSNTSDQPIMTFSYMLPGLSTTSWNTGASAAFSPVINVTAAPDYEIRCSQSWLSPTSKTESSFKLHVKSNSSAYTRTATATIMLRPFGTVIGTVTVTQLGVEPDLMVDANSWNVLSSGGTKSFSVTSNAIWRVESTDNNWLHIEPVGSVTGNSTITVTADANTSNSSRSGTIRIVSDELEEEIKVVQYDEFSENFVELNNDNTISLKSSSDYNHDLATWAMELSYAAYNPISNELIPGIPSGFMQGKFADPAMTAEAELESKGFDATMFNYEGGNSVAAHVIGHKEIRINNTTDINLIGENDNNGDITGTLSGDSIFDSSTNSSNGVSSPTLYNTSLGISDTVILNADSTENETDNTRQLVVVAVRGSVTPEDWAMDVLTQVHIDLLDFEAGRDMVLKSLYGYKDECEECSGDGCNSCKGYLKKNGITNPIILVTGHSLGAAIANLVAAELNEIEGADDVYSYTFATPNVKSYPLDSVITQPTNIFNILNTNDVVTYVPTSWLLPAINVWSRYGIDIPLNMPYSTEQEIEPFGLFSHSMAVYMNWMETHPNITYDTIMTESAEAKTRGLLPWIARIKCPVGVSIKDSEGNIIAYESQEEGITYPEVTDTGIVSWITDDGGKMFFIPSGVDIASVEIEAYDYGSMDFAIGTAGTTDETEIKSFNDVSLYPGKEFLVEVSEDILPEDTQLFVTENGEIVGEVTETDPHLKSVTVTHDERTTEVITYLSFVTDNTVSEIHFYNHQTGFTYYLSPDGYGSIEEDGDNLIWTAGYVYNTAGDYSYDVSVKSGEEWHYYENVFAVHIPQEYIDIKNGTLETNSIQTMSEDLGAEMTPFSSIDDI